VKLLVTKDSLDPDSQSNGGQTPLSWATRFGRRFKNFSRRLPRPMDQTGRVRQKSRKVGILQRVWQDLKFSKETPKTAPFGSGIQRRERRAAHSRAIRGQLGTVAFSPDGLLVASYHFPRWVTDLNMAWPETMA
jgi:hypothetical protein